MHYRHEWKHEISASDLLVLRQRLRALAKLDSHTVNGSYRIRSLYFDTPTDQALREKINGVSCREKFRIRYYNGDLGLIRLEKKSKRGGLCHKDTVNVSADEVAMLLRQDHEWMYDPQRPLVQELKSRMTTQGLAPKVIVDYTREPYLFAPGNVRVTMDYNIRTGLQWDKFLIPDSMSLPLRDDPIVLEVKWDEFLPSIIRDAVQLDSRHTTSFSKYAACRTYG